MRLIDADALIEKYGDWYTEEGNEEGYIGTIKGVIESMPTIEPERKKGVWLPDNNNYYEERFICSVCGKSYKVDTCMGKPMWDFCPCGADMRKEGDKDDRT